MQRWLKLTLFLAWGASLYFLILLRQAERVMHGRLAPLLLLSSLFCLLMGFAYLRPRLRLLTPALSWGKIWLLFLPIVVGALALSGRSDSAVVPPILYLAWDEQGTQQLFKIDPQSGENTQLTQLTADELVLDYALAPAGDLIAYSVGQPDGSSHIWTLDSDGRLAYPLLNCLESACNQPQWSPDGSQLIYERRQNATAAPRLWWLDGVTGDTSPVFTDSSVNGTSVRFSPNGRWISFVVPGAQEIQLFNLETEQIVRLRSETGEAGAWHPTADIFYYNDVAFVGESAVTPLLAADLTNGSTADLTDLNIQVEDGSPVWSSSGDWLAFTRKPARTATGKQLWLMQPASGETRQLTSELQFHHGPPSWSADGRYLTFQRFDTTQPSSLPSIWLYDLETEEARQVAAEGIQPSFLEAR